MEPRSLVFNILKQESSVAQSLRFLTESETVGVPQVRKMVDRFLRHKSSVYSDILRQRLSPTEAYVEATLTGHKFYCSITVTISGRYNTEQDMYDLYIGCFMNSATYPFRKKFESKILTPMRKILSKYFAADSIVVTKDHFLTSGQEFLVQEAGTGLYQDWDNQIIEDLWDASSIIVPTIFAKKSSRR